MRSASTNTARAAGTDSAKARPMPTSCEPCPGKQNATFPRSPTALILAIDEPEDEGSLARARPADTPGPAATADRPSELVDDELELEGVAGLDETAEADALEAREHRE